MDSLGEMYRIGYRPASNHTMGPRRAAELFAARVPDAVLFRVTLFGSLAATGRGHLDRAIQAALDAGGQLLEHWCVYSPGGALAEEDQLAPSEPVYLLDSMQEILRYCTQNGKTFWAYVEECEVPTIWDFLREVDRAMHQAIERGLQAEGARRGGPGPSSARSD